MESQGPTIALDEGLDLQKLVTSNSILNINLDYDDFNYTVPDEEAGSNRMDPIGNPVKSFAILEESLYPLDQQGYVKKKILEEGGGLLLNDGMTVSIAYSAYWENDLFPFDVWTLKKPLVVDLKENGLLPGVLMAIQSMLVGEHAIFLLSHEVAFGELGVPPRIKPRAKCVFYIKLIKSIVTPAKSLNLSEPNMFHRVLHEVKVMLVSGTTLYKSKNYNSAIQLFRKGVNMLNKCRLANENEETQQTKMLTKLHTNLAICYNMTQQPLKSCISCNELRRLNSLWNNSKALFQNAKALRMIENYDEAQKKLRRAIKLSPNNEEIKEELASLKKQLLTHNVKKIEIKELVNDDFKQEVEILIKHFKQNMDLGELELPEGMNAAEMRYVKEACIRENLLFHKCDIEHLTDENSGPDYN